MKHSEEEKELIQQDFQEFCEKWGYDNGLFFIILFSDHHVFLDF